MFAPVLLAPMAGGPGSPELVAAVTQAGGFGFLPAGYQSAEEFRERLARLRQLTSLPVGANLFVPSPSNPAPAELQAYRERLQSTAAPLGVQPGEPVWSDDHYEAKLQIVLDSELPWVSFTFGCPSRKDVLRLHARGVQVMVTVTSADEARVARDAGADALCVQGSEAGGHQGSFLPGSEPTPLFTLLAEVKKAVCLPLVAAGGLMTREDVAAARRAGAVAAQLGTAFMGCPEAGTNATHRGALADAQFTETRLTRAFTGKHARGLFNDFMREHEEFAPACYPEVHFMTRPIRVAAARQGDAHRVHLWAGTGWRRMRQASAAEVLRDLAP